jgi:hypothetical protein
MYNFQSSSSFVFTLLLILESIQDEKFAGWFIISGTKYPQNPISGGYSGLFQLLLISSLNKITFMNVW